MRRRRPRPTTSRNPTTPCAGPARAVPGSPPPSSAAGATYLAAAARLFIGGDDRVRPLLDGSGSRAPSAGPNPFPSAAVGGARTPFVVPTSTLRVDGGARLCEQAGSDEAKACLAVGGADRSPHFVGLGFAGTSEHERYSVRLAATKAGAKAVLRPATPVSLTGSTDLALRVAVPPNSTGNVLTVTVVDGAGKRATLGDVRIDGLPGTANTASYWGQERRVSLSAARAAGVNLTAVAGLELTAKGSAGPQFLIDAWGWRAGLPDPQTRPLTRVDLGRLTLAEGDSGSRDVAFPVTVTGRGGGTINLYRADEDGVRQLAVQPGTSSIGVTRTVTGDKLYGDDDWLRVSAKPVRGVVIGNVSGEVLVTDDDPQPTVTVTPVADKVTEGGTLTYRVTLSEVAETNVYVYGLAQQPPAGKELSTTDVDATWIADTTGDVLPERSLSAAGTKLYGAVEAGKLTGETTVPTVTDDRAEGTENFQAQLFVLPRSGIVDTPGPVFTGTVTDK